MVRVKLRETGHAILLLRMTGTTTSGMTKGAVDRPKHITTPRKNGRNPEVQLLIYPHMYVALTCMNVGNTNLTTSQLRDEDAFDRRQILAATEVSRSYQSATEKRDNHNWDYVGHWPRGKREGHQEAVEFTQKRAAWHTDVRTLAHFWFP